MDKYRKRPIVISAERWFKVSYDREAGHGSKPEDSPIYHLQVGYFRLPAVGGMTKCKRCGDIMHNHGWIDTLEGGHIVCPGDWIIEGIKGEFYPVKDDIFNLTYEKIL